MSSLDTKFGSSELVRIDYVPRIVKDSASLLKDSPIATQFLSCLATELNKQQDNLIWFSENILNLDVAVKWHLDFIGQFVGQDRVLASYDTGVFFGFEGSYQSGTFGDQNNSDTGAVWYNGNSYDASTSKILSDEQYRRIIKARVIKNNTTSASINDLLEVINLITNSTNNTVYLVEHGQLEAKIDDKDGLFAYFLSRQYNQDNLLPIPLGVRLEMVE